MCSTLFYHHCPCVFAKGPAKKKEEENTQRTSPWHSFVFTSVFKLSQTPGKCAEHQSSKTTKAARYDIQE